MGGVNTRRFILLTAALVAMVACVPFLRTEPIRGVRYE